MINFRRYRSFIEVYRVGTVSGPRKSSTSRKRLLANSSQQESQLWENPLFQRTPRRMVPTEAGQILYTQIAGAIDKLALLPRKNSTAQNPQTLRIGTPEYFFTE